LAGEAVGKLWENIWMDKFIQREIDNFVFSNNKDERTVVVI
jgi:hypothetical protein